jgi:hypothetical protein
MALHNDAVNNSLWHSTAVIAPRSCSSATNQNKGKNHVPTPYFKRSQWQHFGQSSDSSNGSFGGNKSKDATSSKGP